MYWDRYNVHCTQKHDRSLGLLVLVNARSRVLVKNLISIPLNIFQGYVQHSHTYIDLLLSTYQGSINIFRFEIPIISLLFLHFVGSFRVSSVKLHLLVESVVVSGLVLTSTCCLPAAANWESGYPDDRLERVDTTNPASTNYPTFRASLNH